MRVFTLVVLITVCIVIGFLIVDPTSRKIIVYNLSDIDDYKLFPNRSLHASPIPFRFRQMVNPVSFPPFVADTQNPRVLLPEFLESTDTLGFLAIKEDTIVYETYLGGHSAHAISMTFSVTKSILSALVGIALEDEYILSVEQPITDYIPELAPQGFQKVKLKHLLQMTSGMGYADHGLWNNPFGKQARLSYTDNIVGEVLDVELETHPGSTFLYKSVDYALLGLALKRAVHPDTLTSYLQKRLWTPLGMEGEGLWSVDREPNGLERTWCCLATTARDLAKIGRLYLHKGNWNGKQLVSKEWVSHSTHVDTTEGSPPFYQYGWYLMSDQYGDFRAEGVRGQFLYVNPVHRTIIVRLGKNRGGLSWKEWKEFLVRMSEHLAKIQVGDT